MTAGMGRLVTPRCPGCGEEPCLLLHEQAFCGTDGAQCRVLMWNPTKTVDENLESLNGIRMPDWLGG